MFLRIRDHWQPFLTDVNQWIFFVTLGYYLLLLVIEEFSPGFVTLYVDPHMLLWVIGLAGLIKAATDVDRAKPITTWNRRDWSIGVAISLVTGLIIWHRLRHLEALGMAIGIGLGLLLILLIPILAYDHDDV